MKRLALLIALTPLVLAAPSAAAPATVTMGEFFFKKDYVQIAPGDSVTWVNRGETQHTVVSRSGSPERYASSRLDAGQSYSRAFAKAGQYRYLCDLHPFQMSGVVQVGPDTVKPTVSAAAATTTSKRIRLRFRLSEDARVSVVVKRGAARVKTFRAKLLEQGGRTLLASSKKGFRAGRYTASFALADRAGNKGKTARLSFRLR